MNRSIEEIQREGLEALRERLGRADMIRFLQLFDSGSGNYADERGAWAEQSRLDDIAEQVRIYEDRK